MTVDEVAEFVAVYPIEAYEFVQNGLRFTVQQEFGPERKNDEHRHVSGRQLCEGLRRYAMLQWGMMARAVLARWNITSTYDFGRIVFALVEGGILHKTDEDTIEDFRNVFEFADFERSYQLQSKL